MCVNMNGIDYNLRRDRWVHALGKLYSTTTGNSFPVVVEVIEVRINPQAAFESEFPDRPPKRARRSLPPN